MKNLKKICNSIQIFNIFCFISGCASRQTRFRIFPTIGGFGRRSRLLSKQPHHHEQQRNVPAGPRVRLELESRPEQRLEQLTTTATTAATAKQSTTSGHVHVEPFGGIRADAARPEPVPDCSFPMLPGNIINQTCKLNSVSYFYFC